MTSRSPLCCQAANLAVLGTSPSRSRHRRIAPASAGVSARLASFASPLPTEPAAAASISAAGMTRSAARGPDRRDWPGSSAPPGPGAPRSQPRSLRQHQPACSSLGFNRTTSGADGGKAGQTAARQRRCLWTSEVRRRQAVDDNPGMSAPHASLPTACPLTKLRCGSGKRHLGSVKSHRAIDALRSLTPGHGYEHDHISRYAAIMAGHPLVTDRSRAFALVRAQSRRYGVNAESPAEPSRECRTGRSACGPQLRQPVAGSRSGACARDVAPAPGQTGPDR